MSDTDTITDAPVVTDFAAMTKAEMVEHLRSTSYHRVVAVNGTRIDRFTKDQLIVLHEELHAAADWVSSQGWDNAKSESDEERVARHQKILEYVSGKRFLYSNILLQQAAFPAHEHLAPVGAADVVASIKRGEKPVGYLNASERKALKELIDNDFRTVEAEIKQFAADVREERKAQVQADFDQKKQGADRFRQELNDLCANFDVDLQEVKDRAARDGLQITGMAHRASTATMSIVPVGLDEAMRKVDQEVNADRDRALTAHRKAWLAAQRTVLLTGVPEGVAQAVLDSIPDARALMAQTLGTDAERKSIESSTT